jgi:putative hemolysin
MSVVALKSIAQLSVDDRYRLSLAYTPEEIVEAQRLRYRVFAEEMGAYIDDGGQRIDRDWLDNFCHHLLVRDSKTGEIVACMRLLTDAQAQAAGGFYSAREFNLRNILALPGRKLEVGRSCVHSDYRSSAAVARLWAGLAEFVRERGFAWTFGCVSIPLHDGGMRAHAISQRLSANYYAPMEARAQPRIGLPPPDLALPSHPRLPSLLKACLNLGAKACGPPHWDAQFATADILLLVQVQDLSSRYARHFPERTRAPRSVRASENHL